MSFDPKAIELLPTKARLDFDYWRSLLEPLLREQAGIETALGGIARATGKPLSTVRKRFYRARSLGLAGLIDRRLCGPAFWRTATRRSVCPVSQCRGLQELWKLLCEQNGRKSYPEFARLVQMWKERDPRIAAIPDYADFPGWPHLPEGWSYSNLMRYGPSDFELESARRGSAAAAGLAPFVYTTRSGLYVGSHYLFDDKWSDFFVNSFAEKKPGRPLEVYSLDLFSACKRRWGVRLRTRDEEGNFKGVASIMMKYILAATLYLDGYSPRGTTLVIEHGTTGVAQELAKRLHEITHGKIIISESGMQGDPAHIGQYPGLKRGNPRHKGALESNNNLEHNAFGPLPGQTGRNVEERPDQLAGLLKYNDELLAAYDQLSPERAAMLDWPLLELNQYLDLASTIYASIARRRDHQLEGWIESGNILQSYNWGGQPLLETQLTAHQREAIPQMLAAGFIDARPVKMSRQEVWDRGSGELIRLPGWGVCSILGDDLSREVRVSSNMIALRDAEIGPGIFRYESLLIDADGRQQVLTDGETYQAFINPFAPDMLFVRDAKGRYLGECKRIHAPCRGDIEGVQRAMGEAVAREAALLAPLKARHLAQAKEKLSLHNTNAKALRENNSDEAQAEKRRAASAKEILLSRATRDDDES